MIDNTISHVALDQFIDSIVNAKGSGSGNQYRLGNYVSLVKGIELKPSAKRTSEVWLIVETLIVRAEGAYCPADMKTDRVLLDDRGLSTNFNPIGSDASFVWDLASQMGPINAKAFFLALSGAEAAQKANDPGFLKSEIKRALAGEFRGYPVSCRGVQKQTKEKKQVISVFNFEHVPATPDEITQYRQALK